MRQAADSSVFVPGYDSPRGAAPDNQSGGHASPVAGWYGAAAGKGPVRGYPPTPGQPPPMYPPGQFSAWNRGPGGQPGSARSAGRAAGPEHDDTDLTQGPPAPHAGSSYYGRGRDPLSEPGYSTLAVSDPAADVTSTQTWRAVEDGRATGTWTVPARDFDGPAAVGPAAGEPPAVTGRSGAHARPADGQARPRPDEGRPPGRRYAPWSPQAAAQRAADLQQASRTDTSAGPTRPDDVADAADGAAAGSGSFLEQLRLAESGAGTDQELGEVGARARRLRAAASGRAGIRKATRRDGTDQPAGHRGHPASVKMAIAAAVVLVLGAAAALYFGARAFSGSGHPAATPPVRPSVTAVPTPTLGPYGHIGTRQSDPEPLTVAQLYPVSFSAGGDQFAQTNSQLTTDCVAAVSGAGIQAAVSSAGCSQVARATYLDATAGMMGTIGVLNLRSAAAAIRTERAAGANNFIAQLPGHSGPTRKLGQGTGIEEAAAKGHYLILIWAELTDLSTPQTTTKRSGLEQFMTELLQDTANVSLSDRMVSGTPS